MERVGSEGGGVGEIEYVEVCVISRSRQFVLCGVGLVDGHTQFDSRCGSSDGYHKDAGVLRPDGAPEFSSGHARQVDSVVGDGDDSRTGCQCVQVAFSVHGDYGRVGLAVEVGDEEMVVGLDEIVGGDAVHYFPVAEGDEVELLADSHL